jgi:5'-3' exonuclease
MGIRKINSYLQSLNIVPEFIDLLSVVDYIKSKSNNKDYLLITIDTNLYMYKYLRAEKQDINTNVILLFKKQINKLIKNNIIPIYIFDSAPDELKKDIIDNRYNKRKKVIEQIIDLHNTNQDYMDENELLEYNNKMFKLNLQSTYVSSNDIKKLKSFFNKFNIPYAIAPEQADVVCAKLVQYNIADACLSEDMDILVSGCKYLIKYYKGKYLLYDRNLILEKLEITHEQLCKFSILLGSDYSRSVNNKILPKDLLEICKKHNFDFEKVLNDIVNVDVHRKYFQETKNNYISLSLSDIVKNVCTDQKYDHNDIIKKMTKHYDLAFQLINLYNTNDTNINDFFSIINFYNYNINDDLSVIYRNIDNYNLII